MFRMKGKTQNYCFLAGGLVLFFTICLLFSSVIHQALAAVQSELPRAEPIRWVGENAVTTNGRSQVQIPIIMYHSILSNRDNNYILSPDELEADLKYLKAEGYQTVVMQDLINFVYNGKKLPDKPIVLTFDDGNYNNMYYAEPLLKQYGFRAIISVVGAFTEKSIKEGDINPNYSYLTWEQMQELDENGIFEIQNHSWNLHDVKGRYNGSKQAKGEADATYKERLYADLNKLQKKIYEVTGKFPTTFTFPFGAVSENQDQYLMDMGFLATLGCEERVSTICEGDPESLFSLGRYNRTPGRSASSILG